jgi:phosphoribosylformimino-5-aminoimidazole carboxamide ribotide isomerase
MIAIPALDVRGGACVQLVGGSYDQERLRLEDPHEVARNWARLGFQRLHLVDLDAATGRGSNEQLVTELLRDREASVQVGGGVRDADAIERLLSQGADRVVVGTRAIEDESWIARTASLFPGQIIVAADVRDRRVVTHGWERTLSRNVLDVIGQLNALALAGVLVTAVHREGKLGGTDLELMEEVVEASNHPVLASGGITTIDDLHALEERGVASSIIGMALYTGVLDARTVAEEFTEEIKT